MDAIVMKVVSAKQHPNADSLRLYEMFASGSNVQIVANMENVYDVDDTVVVVFAGATLKDGTVIRDTKIRGVASYGMALGRSDLWVGTDVSDVYCRDNSVGGFRMQKWPSIESLFNVRRALKRAETEREIAYIGKVKIDGTNAAVQVSCDGKIAAQSRSKIITPDDDNMGFAKWVEEQKDYFSGLAGDKHITIFGEWAGKGIQKRCSISQIDHKVFAVFAIQYGGVNGEPALLDFNPVTIADRLKDKPDNVYALHVKSPIMSFDFTNTEKLQQQADELNKLVAEVERCDPWVKDIFGIEGLGEGLVMYPLPAGVENYNGNEPMMIDIFEYSDLVFKAKGEKHKTTRSKKAVQIDPEIVKSISDFVTLFVTEPRLNQITERVEFNPKNTGTFIKELSQDVLKESVAELEASNLIWKQVAKDVATAARVWFINKCNTI